MTITQLIEALEVCKKEHGDLPAKILASESLDDYGDGSSVAGLAVILTGDEGSISAVICDADSLENIEIDFEDEEFQ